MIVVWDFGNSFPNVMQNDAKSSSLIIMQKHKSTSLDILGIKVDLPINTNVESKMYRGIAYRFRP